MSSRLKRFWTFLQGINHSVYTAQTPELGAVVKNDPDDDKFVECADSIAGRIYYFRRQGVTRSREIHECFNPVTCGFSERTMAYSMK